MLLSKTSFGEREMLDGNSVTYSTSGVNAGSILEDCKIVKYDCNSGKPSRFFRRKDYA